MQRVLVANLKITCKITCEIYLKNSKTISTWYMVSDVNVVLPMSHCKYHRQILSQKLLSPHARFDCQIAQNSMSAGASPQTPLGSSPDYLAGYEWHEGEKIGEMEKRRYGKGKEDGGEGESDKAPPLLVKVTPMLLPP